MLSASSLASSLTCSSPLIISYLINKQFGKTSSRFRVQLDHLSAFRKSTNKKTAFIWCLLDSSFVTFALTMPSLLHGTGTNTTHRAHIFVWLTVGILPPHRQRKPQGPNICGDVDGASMSLCVIPQQKNWFNTILLFLLDTTKHVYTAE